MIRKLAVLATLASTPLLTFAQTLPSAAPSANPVSDALRFGLTRSAKNMSAAAEAMPADKFSFKPTADQMSFAHLAIHIADSNNLFCSKISGVAAAEGAKLAETDSKDKLVAAVKQSFDFCSSALAKSTIHISPTPSRYSTAVPSPAPPPCSSWRAPGLTITPLNPCTFVSTVFFLPPPNPRNTDSDCLSPK